MKTLIIEDEPLILRSVSKMLERIEHQVTGVASGTKAIELIQNNTFDLIICDLMLQDITGFDVIEEVKRFLPASEIKTKFIFMTAYTSGHILDRLKTYECPIIHKPFTDFLDIINKIMEKNGQQKPKHSHYSQTP